MKDADESWRVVDNQRESIHVSLISRYDKRENVFPVLSVFFFLSPRESDICLFRVISRARPCACRAVLTSRDVGNFVCHAGPVVLCCSSLLVIPPFGRLLAVSCIQDELRDLALLESRRVDKDFE